MAFVSSFLPMPFLGLVIIAFYGGMLVVFLVPAIYLSVALATARYRYAAVAAVAVALVLAWPLAVRNLPGVTLTLYLVAIGALLLAMALLPHPVGTHAVVGDDGAPRGDGTGRVGRWPMSQGVMVMTPATMGRTTPPSHLRYGPSCGPFRGRRWECSCSYCLYSRWRPASAFSPCWPRWCSPFRC